MVDFKTRIFSEDDGQIIGAEVLVYSDTGDKIGTIDIADATTLNELKQQLAVIDETYFTRERLEEILSNSSENTVINATKLSGFISSDFAKMSQLTNYALIGHTHTKNQINGLYDYSIEASNYNPKIDSDVNITVTVRDSKGNLVIGQNVEILKNNESWKSGYTNSSGKFVATYTCSQWGLVAFSTNTKSIQVNVEGWRYLHGDSSSTWAVLRNNAMAKFVLRGWAQANKSETSPWNDFGGDNNYASDCRPYGYVMGLNGSNSNVFRIQPSTGHIQYRALNTAQDKGTMNYLDVTWGIRQEDL